jgi:hypothetical protein
MLFFGSLVIFLLAVGAVGAATVIAIRSAGMAMNPNRSAGDRRKLWLAAILSALAVPGAAAAGFAGIVSLFWLAQQPGAAAP